MMSAYLPITFWPPPEEEGEKKKREDEDKPRRYGIRQSMVSFEDLRKGVTLGVWDLGNPASTIGSRRCAIEVEKVDADGTVHFRRRPGHRPRPVVLSTSTPLDYPPPPPKRKKLSANVPKQAEGQSQMDIQAFRGLFKDPQAQRDLANMTDRHLEAALGGVDGMNAFVQHILRLVDEDVIDQFLRTVTPRTEAEEEARVNGNTSNLGILTFD